MAELVRAGALPAGVLTVNLAGEPLKRSLVQAVYAAGAGRVLNLYGPSEDTTYSTFEVVERGGAARADDRAADLRYLGPPARPTWSRCRTASRASSISAARAWRGAISAAPT